MGHGENQYLFRSRYYIEMIRTTSFLIFFIFATIIGWIIDSGYRSFMERRWVNAGYFIGPFCPIYGFGGLLLLVMVSYISGMPLLIRCIFYFIGMTMVEFMGGIFTTKVLKVRLWDYSHAPFNILGHVDLLHSFYWLLLAIVFEGTVWPIIRFLNTEALQVALWLDIIIASMAVSAMVFALIRKMAKERKRIKPFVRGSKPDALWKHLDHINQQYEKLMDEIDKEVVGPSERNTKAWFEKREHYLDSLHDRVDEIQEELDRIKDVAQISQMQKDLKRLSKTLTKRKNDIHSLRSLLAKGPLDLIKVKQFKEDFKNVEKLIRGRVGRSRKKLEWQS
jgi:uncharacterized membrane protein